MRVRLPEPQVISAAYTQACLGSLSCLVSEPSFFFDKVKLLSLLKIKSREKGEMFDLVDGGID